tara:strand:- start:2185 stop:2403 length:219 start_codon:yes stop_codon:yes gene_type:complete
MEEKGNILYRLTVFKANGSVWTKNYDNEERLFEVLPYIFEQFPHVTISRQTLRESPLEYMKKLGERNERKDN